MKIPCTELHWEGKSQGPSATGFPGGSVDKEFACQAEDPAGFDGEDPLEKGQPHSSILAGESHDPMGKSHDQRSVAGYSL